MDIIRVIQYSDLYPEYLDNCPDVRVLVKGIDRKSLCAITVNMVQRLNGKPFFDNSLDSRKDKYDSISFFLSNKNSDFAKDIENRLSKAQEKLPQGYNGGFAATGKAGIMAFQRLFFSVKPDTLVINALIEQNFLKSLLLVNEKVYSAKYDERKYELFPQDFRLACLYLAYNYANEDIETADFHDLFRRQFTKSITLFSFLFRSKDKRAKLLRSRFLAHFHIRCWVEYLIPHILTLFFLRKKSGLLLLKGNGKKGKKVRRVVEKSCICKNDIIPEESNPDYIRFREKPYIRLKKHQYAVTNQTFIIEHMFNSVYFELKKFRKDANFKDDDEFRRYYTTDFSHKYMFEGYVEGCLPQNAQFSLSGSQCDAIIDEARKRGQNTDGVVPPDYYIRTPECCMVFEYKDALAGAKVKESRDLDKLLADIRRNFFEGNKEKHKGVTQILDSAEAIQKKKFYFDNPSSDVVIYPILVVDNTVYTMRGIHTVLDYIMREECIRRGMRLDTIKPLVLMDVATLKLYADFFNANGLIKTIDSYYEYVNSNGENVKNDPFEVLISFTEFMKEKPIGNMQKVFDRILREAKPILHQYNLH